MGKYRETGVYVKEVTVISGKGGTGKTSCTASFAVLAAGKAVLADCDVDAADLHLILQPEIRERFEFFSGHKAEIRNDDCISCGKCREICRYGAVRRVELNSGYMFGIDPVSCEGCGVCVRFCPSDAIDFPEEKCGEWFLSSTRCGDMVHAKLGIAAENSGRLVTIVRNEAKRLAQEQNAEVVLVDGSPGIGCPVIASLTAADLACIIAEPTVSGIHDLERIAGLLGRLSVPGMVSVNKWDINPEMTGAIRELAARKNLAFAGGIRYDTAVTTAQRSAETVVEYCRGGAAEDIRQVWEMVRSAVGIM